MGATTSGSGNVVRGTSGVRLWRGLRQGYKRLRPIPRGLRTSTSCPT